MKIGDKVRLKDSCPPYIVTAFYAVGIEEFKIYTVKDVNSGSTLITINPAGEVYASWFEVVSVPKSVGFVIE